MRRCGHWVQYKSESPCRSLVIKCFIVALTSTVAAEPTYSLNLVIVRTALPYGPYVNYLGMIARSHVSANDSLKRRLSV